MAYLVFTVLFIYQAIVINVYPFDLVAFTDKGDGHNGANKGWDPDGFVFSRVMLSDKLETGAGVIEEEIVFGAKVGREVNIGGFWSSD